MTDSPRVGHKDSPAVAHKKGSVGSHSSSSATSSPVPFVRHHSATTVRQPLEINGKGLISLEKKRELSCLKICSNINTPLITKCLTPIYNSNIFIF